jgi:hypothetical protein
MSTVQWKGSPVVPKQDYRRKTEMGTNRLVLYRMQLPVHSCVRHLDVSYRWEGLQEILRRELSKL